MVFNYFKKAALIIVGLLSLSSPAVHAISLYPVFDKVGVVADKILTRGELSEKHTKMFEEVATKLGIEKRKIKVRNTGLLLRFVTGYSNAMAIPYWNRVYMNEDSLAEMSDEAKKFIMAHELVHHREHHIWKRLIVGRVIDKVALQVVLNAKNKEIINGNDALLTQYFTYGCIVPQNSSWLTRGLFRLVPEPSIWGLAKSQYSQSHEIEADAKAVTIAGMNPEAGVEVINYLYYPTTANWPLYAKVSNIVHRILLPIMSLPILKEHVSHPAHKDRVAHLMSLKEEWQKKHGVVKAQ